MGEKCGTGRGEGNLWMVAVPRFFRRSKKTSAAARITPTQEAVMTVKDVKQKDYMSANFILLKVPTEMQWKHTYSLYYQRMNQKNIPPFPQCNIHRVLSYTFLDKYQLILLLFAYSPHDTVYSYTFLTYT